MKLKTTKKILFWAVILAILALGFIYYTPIQNTLSDFLEDQIAILGYYGIFISVFLLELIPQPLISALLPFTTGLLLDLKFFNLLLILLIGSITANYLAYFIGIIYGEKMARYFISEKNYNKSVQWFDKYGMSFMTILALTPLPYFPIMGGIFHMTFKEFTMYAIIPRIFHLVIFSFLIGFII